MKLPIFSLSFLTLWLHLLGIAMGQGESTDPEYKDDLPFEPMAECTRKLAATNDCADVINPNACYNQYKFSGTRTLSCIEGKSDADRQRKVCLQSISTRKIRRVDANLCRLVRTAGMQMLQMRRDSHVHLGHHAKVLQ